MKRIYEPNSCRREECQRWSWTGAHFMIGGRGDEVSIKAATWCGLARRRRRTGGRVGKRCSSVDKGVKTRRGDE